MRFAEPFHFVLLIAVVILGLLMVWAIARKRRLLSKFGDLALISRMAPYISFGRQRLKALLVLLALTFGVVALARLQFGTHLEMLKREGIDIIVALDVSNSMLAQDIKPSRMEKARQELRGVIDRLDGDRIGLVAFAGEAFVQCPLTLDYAAARLLLQSMDEQSVSHQGTSLSAAIAVAANSFDEQNQNSKVLIFLTDGEDMEGGAIDAAQEAAEKGIKIHAIGIGNPAGQPIPVLDRQGNQIGFKKDENGEVVVSRLDEETLQKVVAATKGTYYNVSAGEMELDKIFDEIGSMEKKELAGTLVTKYDDRFQWPLLLAIVFLVAEFFISERRRPQRSVEHA